MKYNIQEFYIGEASYFVSDGNGANVHLILNYVKNTYEIRPKNQSNEINEVVLKQVKAIAVDLLRRKAGINLAKNLKRKGIIR